MRKIIAAITIFLASGCTTAPEKAPSTTCFRSTDAIRYNSLLLRLQPDGWYSAKIQGDIGVRGATSGTWKETDGNILLTPSQSSGEALPTSLKRVSQDSLIALPVPGAYDYRWASMKQVACGPN